MPTTSKSPTTTAADLGGPMDLTRMRRPPTHPGEIFKTEFREPAGISQAEASRRLKIPTNRLNTIEVGTRAVSPETAWLFAAATGTSPEFWMNLQARYDLWHAYQTLGAPKVKRLKND